MELDIEQRGPTAERNENERAAADLHRPLYSSAANASELD
jgi:hypothetical protein